MTINTLKTEHLKHSNKLPQEVQQILKVISDNLAYIFKEKGKIRKSYNQAIENLNKDINNDKYKLTRNTEYWREYEVNINEIIDEIYKNTKEKTSKEHILRFLKEWRQHRIPIPNKQSFILWKFIYKELQPNIITLHLEEKKLVTIPDFNDQKPLDTQKTEYYYKSKENSNYRKWESLITNIDELVNKTKKEEINEAKKENKHSLTIIIEISEITNQLKALDIKQEELRNILWTSWITKITSEPDYNWNFDIWTLTLTEDNKLKYTIETKIRYNNKKEIYKKLTKLLYKQKYWEIKSNNPIEIKPEELQSILDENHIFNNHKTILLNKRTHIGDKPIEGTQIRKNLYWRIYTVNGKIYFEVKSNIDFRHETPYDPQSK